MDHHLERGQIYRACTPVDRPPRHARILGRHPGGRSYRIADAATGQRERDIDVGRLHQDPVGRAGAERRTGYVHVSTHEWFIDLVDQALRGHPYIVAGSAVGQDARRGGTLRLRPEVTLEAVRAIAAALEAATWTVEPSLGAVDELRVRYLGRTSCPAIYRSPGEPTWICERGRGHRGEHQDQRTLGAWENEHQQVPELPAWWLPGQPLPGQQLIGS
ncbi:hypothetical protein [Streptomyces sp. H39-S7]|uniref:hypothetical protein n=1 Tax=Streptomyces sp. H39-S7 TaxID=3004357 RepID=UPI0022AF8DB9|nr:hypothetical protein [Streptomyces sp. H39-S7]MCZ4124995.1 hypothetical protein [Streptomyces sp. H39-S7]